jgi:hypothetical protein
LSEPGAAGQRTKQMIENFSNLVFGLALSLGSIILISKSATTPDQLITNVALFGFSFIIVVWIWAGYTRTISFFPFEIPGTFVLNIALLFCVSISPYLFYVLSLPPQPSASTAAYLGFLDFASSVYALDAGAMMLILAGMTYLLLREEGRRTSQTPGFSRARFTQVMYAEIGSGSIFWASSAPFLWIADPFGSFIRFDMWYFVFIVFFAVINVRFRRGAERGSADR